MEWVLAGRTVDGYVSRAVIDRRGLLGVAIGFGVLLPAAPRASYSNSQQDRWRDVIGDLRQHPDIPNLAASQITSGTLVEVQGGTGATIGSASRCSA